MKYAKKRDTLTEKWENVLVLEIRDFPAKRGNVDTYAEAPLTLLLPHLWLAVTVCVPPKQLRALNGC